MKQERRQNGRCNRVVRLKKPDGLLEARDFSHGFFTKRQFYPYTIYTNQNHEYHAENLIFYSIEQKGLFTDPGRRADSPQSTPMGSRCLLFLLSVNACGSSQGKEPPFP